VGVDHTHHNEDNAATGVPGTCQVTQSAYGPVSDFLMWGMNFHCEHHDHPKIGVHDLPRLKKLYPEFYNHIHWNYHFTHLWKWLRNREDGYRYAACAEGVQAGKHGEAIVGDKLQKVNKTDTGRVVVD
jgi:fatty acid desaturase